MGFYPHIQTFAGRPVAAYDAPDADLSPKKYTPRIALEHDAGHTFREMLTLLLDRPWAARSPGLVVGPWDYDTMIDDDAANTDEVAALVEAAPQLPALRHLFLGDILSEECEVSWIEQSDVSPLLAAYPLLTEFRVRGGSGLAFAPLRHTSLTTLIVETGGLSDTTLAQIFALDLPHLTHLELWLGDTQYGGIESAEPLRPLLAGGLFPSLRYLGLRDSCVADDVARAVADSPLCERIETLDLSMGNLADDGMRALAASPRLAGLKRLDISHHYGSTDAVAALEALGPEVREAADDPQDPYISTYGGVENVYRYVAVSE